MAIGGFIAYLFETPSRHSQLLSFMMPKALETLYNLLSSRGFYKQKDWHAKAIVLIAWAIIAYSAIREYRKEKK